MCRPSREPGKQNEGRGDDVADALGCGPLVGA
jgi:hypothetical protein